MSAAQTVQFTVKSTREQRYDQKWRMRLDTWLAAQPDVTVVDIGGGSGFGPGLVADNDYEVTGSPEVVAAFLGRLRERHVVQVWESSAS